MDYLKISELIFCFWLLREKILVDKKSFNLPVYLSTSLKQTLVIMGLVPSGYFCTFGNDCYKTARNMSDHVFHTHK